jgi:hypothetical protein
MAGASNRRGSSASKHGKHRHIAYKSDHSVKPAPTNSEINVTPLVDVCLVLLIIFMVVTPMLGRGVDVQLPLLASASQHKEATRCSSRSTTRAPGRDRPLYRKRPVPEPPRGGPQGRRGQAARQRRQGPDPVPQGRQGHGLGKVKTVMEWITSSNVQMQDIALVVDLPEST